MVARLLPAILVSAFLLVLPPAPISSGGQQPPPPASRPAFDAEAVVREVNAFYAEYWKAWENRDLDRVAAALDPEFIGYAYVAPTGVVQANQEAAVAGVRQFFDSVRGRETLWGRSVLAVVPRSPTEAIVAVRNEFFFFAGGSNEIEITIEVLRRGADGRWRLRRKWSEKHSY